MEQGKLIHKKSQLNLPLIIIDVVKVKEELGINNLIQKNVLIFHFRTTSIQMILLLEIKQQAVMLKIGL